MPIHFVPPRKPSRLRTFFQSLFTPQPKPKTKPQPKPVRADPVQTPAPIYAGDEAIPPFVWRIRDQGREAAWLLSRYCRGLPVSRRQCMAAGMSDGSWRRARRILQRAGIISHYDGRLLRTRRDAELRLAAYMAAVEDRARRSDRFVAP